MQRAIPWIAFCGGWTTKPSTGGLTEPSAACGDAGAKVADRGGCAATDFAGAADPARAAVRHPGAAGVAGRGQPAGPHSAWCWPMRSLIPRPTTNTFGNAWERRASSPPSARTSLTGPSVIRCTGPFRKNHIANAPSSKRSSRSPTQTFLARSGAQPAHANPPSAAARPDLPPLSLEASPRSSRMSTEVPRSEEQRYD
jgi:hypothetical protein